MKTLRAWVCSTRLFGTAIAIAVMLCGLAPGLATAHGDGQHVDATIANADGDQVLLRSGPGFDQEELARYPEGTQVAVVDGPFSGTDGTHWYQVEVDGKTGYMVGEYLNPDTSFDRTSGQAVANDSANVRSGPSTADDVVTYILAGDVVTLTGGYDLGWVSISARGGDGWVYGRYLTASDDGETPSGETRWTLQEVNLRTGPGETYDSIAVLPVGVELSLTGDVEGEFAKVTSSFGDGWVYTQVIGPDAPTNPVTPEPTATTEPTVEPTAAPTEEPGETGTRWTQESVHLRAGPSTGATSLAYLEAGVELQLTGETFNGFAQVESTFGTGWVFAEYIGETAPGSTPDPETPAPDPETPTPTPDPETPTPDPETPEPGEPVTRWTNADVNMRSEASSTSSVVSLLPLGTEVQFSGTTANGFSQVTAAAGTGWIASEYLSETQPEEPTEPEPSDSLIQWPVTGGEWTMLQGYNGSSHQNRSSSWQYLYSLDLVRADGDTAGQPVYSPVSGTMRWIDEASGGGSIYMGDDLAFAFFHTVMDPSIQEGDTITQGQYLGTIAPAYQFGAGSNPHLHISIWETHDDGNWSRIAIPFTGRVAIEGIEFPADGSGNQWRGFDFTP